MRSTEQPERLAYKVPEVATQLGLSERQVWRLIQAGEIAAFKIAKSRRVTHQALLDYIDRLSTAA